MKEYVLDKIVELLNDAENYIKDKEELKDLYTEIRDLVWDRDQAME